MSLDPVTTRVATLTAPFTLSFEERLIDVQDLLPDQLLVKTLYSAISPGTEIAAWNGSPPLRPGNVYPRLVGYCNVGEVVACGSMCGHYQPGDHILSFSSHCSYSLLQEADVLAKVPDGVSDIDSAKTYLFHLGYSAILTSLMPAGSNVVVIGFGVLGVASAVMAYLSGWNVDVVTNTTISPEFRNMFPRISFYKRTDIPVSPYADVVITTTNSWSDWDLALKLPKQRGQLIVLGFPGRSQSVIPFNPLRSSDFYLRQLRISASGMQPENSDTRGFTRFSEKNNINQILNWISEKRLIPDCISSKLFPAHLLEDAYIYLSSNERICHTIILDWESSSWT